MPRWPTLQPTASNYCCSSHSFTTELQSQHVAKKPPAFPRTSAFPRTLFAKAMMLLG